MLRIVGHSHKIFCVILVAAILCFSPGKYSHPNIVRLVDICHGERNPGDREMVLYLVFEHMDQVVMMVMVVVKESC